MSLVVSIGRLTAFYVVIVPMELIRSEPPPYSYVIVLFYSHQEKHTQPLSYLTHVLLFVFEPKIQIMSQPHLNHVR